MKETQEYEFWIDAYSPEDIPMKRLGEYMAQLGKLLGEEDRVHFKEVRSGSTKLAFGVEREATQKVFDRVENIKRAEAANDVLKAKDQLNEMLRQDGAIGELRRVTTAGQEPMLRLAGREIPKPQKVGPFSEPAIFKGELVRLEGADDTKHASILDSQGRLWAGYMSRTVAIGMREYIFESVMVSGAAQWIRTEKGEWEVKSFEITGFKPLGKDSLEEDLHALRQVPGNQWKEMDDPLGYIREQRKDDDEIH
jgi:hypothetical protein